MKIVLVSINAKYIHTNNAVRLLKANSDFPIEILEFTIKDSVALILEAIESSLAEVVGFSVYIWNVALVLEILESIHMPGSKIVLGGPEVSYDSLYFMKKYKIDFIVKGEGEIAFNDLLHAISSNGNYREISNLTYWEKYHIVSNDIVEIPELSILKQPYYFKDDISHIPNKVSYIESSRGCPYNCSYCLSSLEKTVRFFDVSHVKKAILYLMDNGSKTIKFLDRTFNANKNTLELLSFIIANDNNLTVFQFEITGDILDKKIIAFLNKNAPKGLFRFEIGIQSINYETNFLVDRFQDTEKLFENIRLIQNGEIIDLHLDLIAGLPKEDLQQFKITFNEVFNLNALELQLGFLKLLRGTKIRYEAGKYNYFFQDTAPYEIISNESLSEPEISEIHLVEHMLDIYHNKGYFGENLSKYISSTKDPYSFFKNIGNYYLENQYSFKGYQIEDVYQRLFDYLNDELEIFNIKKDYLSRSKIKPKVFWKDNFDKAEKKTIFEQLIKKEALDIGYLHKHAVIIKYKNEFYVTLYKDLKSYSYEIRADID